MLVSLFLESDKYIAIYRLCAYSTLYLGVLPPDIFMMSSLFHSNLYSCVNLPEVFLNHLYKTAAPVTACLLMLLYLSSQYLSVPGVLV